MEKRILVEKPDVFICKKCGNRFQKAKFVQVPDEDGIAFTRPSCPECGNIDLEISSWMMKQQE